MKNIILWVVCSLAGLVGAVLGGYFFGGLNGAMIGMFAGIIQFMPVMMMLGTAKNKGFLPLFTDLGEFEKYVHFPDKFGRLKTLIVNTRHEGICHKKGIGIIDDKGTEYCWGDCPASFGEPKLGMTIDVKTAKYTDILEEDENIEDYDNAIKEVLGDDDYKNFVKKFRTEKIRPDIYEINKELDFLLDAKLKKKLEKEVFGETWGFKNYIRWLKYAYHPQTLENAIDTEKVWVKQEAMGYRDVQKTGAWAKAIIAIGFTIMIIIIVLSSVDLSNFANLFGGA